MKLERMKSSRPVRDHESENPEKTELEATKSHVLQFAQMIHNGEADAFDFLQGLPDNEKISASKENRWTEMFRAIFAVAKEHPEFSQELGEMEQMIVQNPQMMHPAHIIDIASAVMWDPRIHDYLKSNMIHGLGYALRFMKSEEYEKAIAAKLDFDTGANFSNTAHFLEFMQSLYNVGDNYSYDGDSVVTSRVHSALSEAVSKGKGSYLLNIRARQLLEEMDGRDHMWADGDRFPFLISGKQYAWHKNDGLYTATPDENESIAELVKQFQEIESKIKPPQHLVDEAIARGESEVRWSPDARLVYERTAKYSQISRAFTHRVTYDELAKDAGGAKDLDEKFEEEHDFAYLTSKPIREIIERDFEINLRNLTLQDQYKLLRVLKAVPYGKATPLLLEATRALWKSEVKDYLNEIRGGSLEVVTGNSIGETDGSVMQEILLKQYKEKYPEGELQELREGLDRALTSKDSRFYVYRKDGEILTFVRFDDLSASDTRGKYMGSFMTNPKFERGALGQALLETALKKELEKGAPLYAVCDPSLVPFYERFGFTKLREYKDDYGVDTCDIVLEPESGSLREAA